MNNSDDNHLTDFHAGLYVIYAVQNSLRTYNSFKNEEF